MSDMKVLLLGAGRYGNGLVGKKYVNGSFDARLIGVVDPKIDEIKTSLSYNLKGVPTYHSLEEIPADCAKDCVADIALMPELVSDSYKRLADMGVKKIILPKPVVTNKDDFKEIIEITKDEDIEALIASNWHYASITKLVRTIINKLTGKQIEEETVPCKFVSLLENLLEDCKIKKVEVQYNKKNGVPNMDPPLKEFPHAVQIVNSTECTDVADANIGMFKNAQTKTRVNTVLKDKSGIKTVLNSDFMVNDKLKEERERILKIYLENNHDKIILTADYDAKFAPNGQCIKPQSIKYESLNFPENNWNYRIIEDNINVMYKRMFDYFEGDMDNNSLTIEKYTPIAKFLCRVESMWKNLVGR